MKIKRNPTIFFIVIFCYPLLFDRTLIIKLNKILKQGYVDLIDCMPRFHNEYLEKIFNERFNEISKDRLKKIGYTELKNRNINEALENKVTKFNTAFLKVKNALVFNDDQGKILDMHPNELLEYFNQALKTGKVDVIRKETKHLKAVVYEVGKPLIGFEFIKKDGMYKQYHVEQLEKIQKRQGFPTVKWFEVEAGEIIPMSGTITDKNTGEEIEGSKLDEIEAATNAFKEKEEKKENIQELYEKLKNKLLSLKCRKLFNEWIPRERDEKDFNLKVLAKDKKMNYNTLKTDFARCLDQLIEIYPKIDEPNNNTNFQPS